MKKYLAIFLLVLLTGLPCLAGVAGESDTVPHDPDGPPPAAVSEHGGQQADTPGSGSLRSAADSNHEVHDTALSRRTHEGSSAASGNPLAPEAGATPGAPATGSSYPAVPGGNSTWPMLAIAILLLLFAGGGGYYFYARKEE
ncbi:MAG: hypothetical protein KC910_20015 [Candidatus Eremiobacteraeota bacterium]|nr:hypothetical protein [Candidatus Eremiobacteraeota bacterium]